VGAAGPAHLHLKDAKVAELDPLALAQAVNELLKELVDHWPHHFAVKHQLGRHGVHQVLLGQGLHGHTSAPTTFQPRHARKRAQPGR
jgi:hypothetical protein